MQLLKRNIDIALILSIGFILRFSVSITHSYSNDELSAISRLRFDNLSDLVEFGVMKGDMHPAGVQFFMKFWGALFGKNEMVMRFPFVLFGTASIFVLFLIGKNWFNRKTGLIAASFLAVLYFPIMNSEFARPYSPGLLLILLIGYFIYKVLFDDHKKEKTKQQKLVNSFTLGLLFALAMYTHYFAFLCVGFIGISGILFLNSKNWMYYILAGVLGIILFLPHVGVTYYHLNVGGLQWLGAPENNWLFLFLFHAFNESYLLVVPLLLFTGFFIIKKNEYSEKLDKKAITLLTIWFFGVYLLGHILSLISTPVLKFPVMLFTFPFFLLLVSIVLAKAKNELWVIIPIILLGSSSTVIEKDLYGNRHFALFKEVGQKINKWNEVYGAENIYTIYNLNNPNYMNFYAEEWGGDSIKFDLHELEFDGDFIIHEKLQEASQEYCIIGYSARTTVLQIFETVREFYPLVIDFEQYNNGAVFLMKKGAKKSFGKTKLIADFNPSTGVDSSWSFNSNYLSKTAYLLDEENKYGPDFKFNLKDHQIGDKDYIKIVVNATILEGGLLTAAISGERNGKLIQHRNENFWMGRDLEHMINYSESNEGFFAFKIPAYILQTDQLKISLWNRGESKINIHGIQIFMIENHWN